MPVPRALRPFSVGQFRILAGALVISLLGSGAWLLALVFQVRELGGSPSDLSFVAALNALGLLIALLIGGVVADRVPQKRILIAVEVLKTAGFALAATLGLSGGLELWHLAVISLAFGIGDGFFFPAYTALLPSVLPADDLLAANGIEGVLRPSVQQALGPLLASAVVAAFSPAAAFLLVAVTQLAAVVTLVALRATPVRREPVDDAEPRHPVAAVLADIGEGFRYMVRTAWLLGTLLFASLFVLVVIGPLEVLLPFAVVDQAGGGPGSYALVLGVFAAGGALASIAMASVRLPRRYLSVMNLAWGSACLPLAVIGFTDQLWVMAVAVFVTGLGFGAGSVIWGTLLQRRVPPSLLGRVSSLDWFVSSAFMPVSMAVAGPVGELIGFGPAFLIAGVVPIVLAAIVLIVFRMRDDELAHPLDPAPDPAPVDGSPQSASGG